MGPSSVMAFSLGSADLPVVLTIDNKRVFGRVSVEAMCLASPVWKKFIYPPFGGMGFLQGEKTVVGREDEPLVESEDCVRGIDFTEDHGKSIMVLLKIAHLDFAIPSNLQDETLQQIAVLCDKYDCVKLVKPWLNLWLETFPQKVRQADSQSWLFTAWEFGREDEFRSASRGILLRMKTNPIEDLEMESVEGGVLTPPGIIESIIANRNATINSLLDVPYNAIAKFTYSRIINCSYQIPACDALFLGTLIRSLESAGLWPRPEPEDLALTIEELMNKFNGFQTFYDDSRIWNHPVGVCNKTPCLLFSKLTGDVIKAMGDPVLDSHREHMKLRMGLLAETETEM